MIVLNFVIIRRKINKFNPKKSINQEEIEILPIRNISLDKR